MTRIKLVQESMMVWLVVACRTRSRRYCYCLMWPPRVVGANSAKLFLLLVFTLASLLQKKGLLFPEHGCRPNLVTSFLRTSASADANSHITHFHLSVFLSFLLPFVWTSNSSSLLVLICCSSGEIKSGKYVIFKCMKQNPRSFKRQYVTCKWMLSGMKMRVSDHPGLQGNCSAPGVGRKRGVNADRSAGLAVTFFLLLEVIGCKTDSLQQSSSSLGLLCKKHLKSNFAM